MGNALINKGILHQSGEISKDKINLISGAHTPPFVEMLWTVTAGDTDTTDRLYNLLSYLQQYEPGELKKTGPHEFCTVTHDNLKISNGKWHWITRGFGGKTAFDKPGLPVCAA